MNLLKCIQHIIYFQGFSEKAYKDSMGRWFIGFGRNLEENYFSNEEIRSLDKNDIINLSTLIITKEVANELLINDVHRYNGILCKFSEYRQLNDNRKMALIDIAHHIGIEILFLFSKMWNAIKHSDYQSAAMEIILSEYGLRFKDRAFANAQLIKEG